MLFIPDFVKGSVTDFTVKPRREGQLLFGTDGRVRLDHEDGHTLYSSFRVFSSLATLNATEKFEDILYCVGASLYRWSNTPAPGMLIPIGGTPGQDFSTVYITKILDISADGKTGTVQCLDGNGEATGAIFDDVSMLGSITAIGGTAVVNMGETAWSLRATPADNKWLCVCHGNGRFVAISSDGTHRVMTSTDGRDWTLCNASSVTNGGAWQSVCFGNGVFVAVASSGTNRVMVSTDGLNWTAYKAAAQNSWRSICFGNNRFVAVSSDGTKRVMYSTDNGQTWSLPAVKPIANPWRSVCFGNGKFLAVASSGTYQVMVSSDNGVTWIGYKASASRAYRSVCFGEGQFAAVSSGAKSYHCMVSENDGMTWTSYTMPNQAWQSVCYGDGLWVTVANSGSTSRVLVAEDGHSWARKLVPKNLNWQSVCYGNGLFVGVAASGKGDRAMTSEPTSFNINYGFVGNYALVVEFEGTKFAVLQGGSLTGDPVEDEEQREEEGLLDDSVDLGALIETHNDDADAHAELFAAIQELTEEHLEDEEAHQPLFDAKQNKITATGQTNLLTAPTALGGQPGTKPISDFATAAQGAKADTAVQPAALTAYAKDADVVKLTGNQTIAGTKTFSTSPVVPTKTSAAGTSGTAIATEAQVNLKANLASPTFTGTVKVPSKTTAAANDGTLVATEAQVFSVKSTTDGKLDKTAQAADSAKFGGKLPSEYEPAFTKNTAFNKKLGNTTVQTAASAAASTTASRTYPVQVNASEELVVNVPWSNTTYAAISQANIENTAGTTAGLITGQRFKQAFDANVIVAGLITASNMPKATSTAFGTVKLGSDTVQTATAAAVGTTASRTYLVQKNGSDQLVVNVPWTDTNTNTTYSTITQAEIDAGTGTATRVVTPKLLADNFAKKEHTHSQYANDADVVKLTGNQTIAGTKTFSTSPVVPTKTSAAGTSGTAIATEAQVNLKANLASPTFTGTVKVPSKTTAATNDGTLVATEAQVKSVADGKQNSITSTGTTNLLTAPSSSGGNPGTAALNTFMRTTGNSTANAALDANSQRIINLATPTGTNDAAPKTYVDSKIPNGTNQVLMAPTSANGNATTKALSDLMASPAVATANRRLLLAPATKGNAPDMMAAPTVVGTVPTFDGSNIVWQRPGSSSTTLTAHLIINGYPVWIFLDDANVARYGEWMAYEAGTYLIVAVGSGGNGGNGSSSGTNVYCGGEGGSGGLAVSRYSVTSSQLSSYKAVDRRFLRWRSTAAGAIYIYVTDTTQSTGVRTMTAAVGSNGATSTSNGVGNGGAGGLGSGGNVANFRGAGGMGGIRTNGSGNIGSVGNGGIDGTRQDGTGSYNDYMGKRFDVNPNGWTNPRFNGRYFHHQATGVFLPHNWLPNSIGGNFTIEMGGGVGGGGGAADGWYDRNQGYGGPGAVIIIKES